MSKKPNKLQFPDIHFLWCIKYITAIKYLGLFCVGRRKLSLQIIFQNEDDCDATVNILNSLKAEINDGLSGIEFIIATKGSLILDVYILLKMMETDEILQCTLTLFVEKILEHITISTPESIDMIVLPVEGKVFMINKSVNNSCKILIKYSSILLPYYPACVV